MVDSCVADLRQRLAAGGEDAVTSEQLLEQWCGERLTTHVRTWLRVWVPFCRRRELDEFEYAPKKLAQCLAAIQKDTEEVALLAGKPPQHSRMKGLRAAVSGLWGVLHEKDAARASLRVKAIQKRAERVAPMRTKNSTTWDVQLVFDWLRGQFDRGLRFTAITGPAVWPEARHRAVGIMLTKLSHLSRSADVNSLSRGFFRGREGPRLCLVGDEATGTINKIRWWRPKNVGSGVGDYSPFKTVGAALATPAHPEYEAFCLRTCVESYFRRTQDRPRGDDGMWLSTRPGRRVGEGSSARWCADGLSYAISRDTARNDVGWVMHEAGVPAEFRPHSSRAASSAAVRRLGGSEHDVLRRANLSSKVYRDFYEKPIVAATGGDVAKRPSAAMRSAFGWVDKPAQKRRRRGGRASEGAPRVGDSASSSLALEDR